jgi:hypothetical protein
MKPQHSIYILITIVCFALSPQTRAADTPNSPDPPPFPISNTADGTSALAGLTTGIYNSAFGIYALLSNGAADFNTGIGAGTLFANTANENTATGAGALFTNTTGGFNTANGAFALFLNADGARHTAIGNRALQNCIAPPDFAGNTAVGTEALFSDTIGNFNTAIGDAALFSNTEGSLNTAIGLDVLISNTTGTQNTATGGNALFNNTEGVNNTATGIFALFSNTTGITNTAVGSQALNANITGNSNTAVGNAALINSTGDGNTALGNGAGLSVGTASNVICIGNNGADVSDSCFIGNISGVAVAGDPVVVDGNGQLGVAPAGSPLSANELLKQQRVVQELKATAERQAAVIALQDEQIKALTAGLQKVSAQLEASKPAPQMVNNNQ